MFFIGVLSSAYANGVMESWPMADIPFPRMKPGVGSFYVMVAVFVVLYLLRELAIAAESDRLHNEVMSMPPVEAFHTADRAFDQLTEYLKLHEQELDGRNLAPIEEAIRVCLYTLVTIATNISLKKRANFAANVMLWRPIETLKTAEDKDEIFKKLRFFDGPSFEAAQLSLKGFLELDLPLSVRGTKPDFLPDSKLKAMALPIPKEPYIAPTPSWPVKRYRFLPGPPAAFILGSSKIDHTLSLFPNFADEQDLHAGLTKDIYQQIDAYFRSGETGKVRSLASLAIGSPRVGVVTVFCDQPEVFASSWSFKIYENLATPTLTVMGGLMRLRDEEKLLNSSKPE